MKYFQLYVAAAGLMAAATVSAGPSVDVLIQTTHPGAIINEQQYGQALGTGGGLWVGPESTVPNLRGWRLDMVDAITRLQVPVLRWPAGCAAERYHWRDGVGPRAQRPLRRDPEAARGIDDNAVGTHEFFDLAELTGASAYVSANIGTGSAREAAEWVEYMEAESGSTLGQWRTQHGHPAPFKPRFVGIGAAPWGCGGNMSASYYADLYNQYAVFIRGKSEQPPSLVASGNGPAWTEELSAKKRVRDYRDAISAHEAVEERNGQDEAGWIATLQQAMHFNAFIASNIAQLDKNDPKKKLSLVIDGWRTRAAPAAASQQNTLRDALSAALHFYALHDHADRVSMASFAAPLNSSQAMVLAEGSQLILTPTYHAFRMHVPFQGATTLPLRLEHNTSYTVGKLSIPALSASAARAKDGKLHLSLVNTDPQQALTVVVHGAAVNARGSVLTAPAMDAYNSAAAPQAVAPSPLQLRGEGGRLRITLPPKSLTVLAIDE